AGPALIRCPRDQVGVLHAHRGERIRGVAGVAVVVARDVTGFLSGSRDSVVTTETAAAGSRVIHVDNRRKIVD
ncbi:hypothetical protein ABTM96_20010, partial [Acinetobacter baumannii]